MTRMYSIPDLGEVSRPSVKACRKTLGYSAMIFTATGCLARKTALAWFHCGYGFLPHPSRMMMTRGRLDRAGMGFLSRKQRGEFTRVDGASNEPRYCRGSWGTS